MTDSESPPSIQIDIRQHETSEGGFGFGLQCHHIASNPLTAGTRVFWEIPFSFFG